MKFTELLFVVLIVVLLACIVHGADVNITSAQGPFPVPEPGRPTPRWQPPQQYMVEQIATNRVPLVVEETVYSNYWLRVLSYQRGELKTNDVLLSSNVVSVATNTLAR